MSHVYKKHQDALSDQAFEKSYEGLGHIGYYSSSIARGTFWAGMIGGKRTGQLHGTIDTADGTITGNNISYIYPDMETALLGKFTNGKMQDTQESILLETRCDENGLLYVSRYSTPDSESPPYRYDPPNNVSFGSRPQLAIDPYENKWLEVRASTNEIMGDGVFLKRDIGPYTLLSSYSG